MKRTECSLSSTRGVAVVTLQAPERRNLLTAEMVRALSDAFDQLEADPSIRCAVLTGAGSAFCAGADLSTLDDAAHGRFEPVQEVYEGFLRVLRSPLPTIAAVNGPAVGAGFNLALACDVRLAAESAVFDTRFARLHLHPGGGHTWLLAQAVGRQHATVACLFGQVWTAEEAHKRGLVAEVHADGRVLDAAVDLGQNLNAHDGTFVRRLTATIRQSAVTPEHQTALAAETEAQRWSTQQPAFLTGVRNMRDAINRRRAREDQKTADGR
ncbi:enoyl-CoA hydratase [Streptomyces luteolifulvus]|uniref:Enoyl-CoA hydratase n=1 Tax=Streptomyces luteolifulvus TaxID=2615112 RepID=A0A6H9UNS3_9ACTN|nr:enoyl-CoA hydratase-related protein [Streptomyces luteolifulvus]KAB1139643.1 enoyl-CoA hydratase [Streptomyces luteolifulvus]